MAASARHETRALLRAHLAAASSYGHLTSRCPACHRLLRLAMESAPLPPAAAAKAPAVPRRPAEASERRSGAPGGGRGAGTAGGARRAGGRGARPPLDRVSERPGSRTPARAGRDETGGFFSARRGSATSALRCDGCHRTSL
ncbi:DUF6274 family protein [Streptomyces sp. Tu 6176]|uniref:DUF6274 family protein n=1 Tax=Streptomyces sp. Tu 6176 TaxID=1470557 RepID=UPI0009989751